MIITGLLLFLIGTNLSYSYPSSIRYEKPCSPSIEDVDRVSKKSEPVASNIMPCHANNKVTKELRQPCDEQNIQDNTLIDEPVTVEDIPCPRDSEEQTYIPAEIPPAPVLPPFKLSESPIVVEDVDLSENEEITQPCQVSESLSIDIGENAVPCSHEITNEDEENYIIPKNLPTPPELPPLVPFGQDEDCENNDEVSILPSREPSQALKLQSHDIEEENIPCLTETSEEDEKETLILPNIRTPPELPPLVSFSEEEDCENNDDVSTLPSREPTQALKLPSQSHDIEEENIPCLTETSEDDEKETPILPNLPTPPALPPLVSFSKEEDCENNDDVSTFPSREPSQALKLPSHTHDIEEENIPCLTKISEDNEKETPILNIPTPPELPPLVSFSEEEDCENNDDALKLPSQSHDIVEENIPCPTETFEDDETETSILPNLPTPPELPPLVPVIEEKDCEDNDDDLTLPSRKPTQALKLPTQSLDIEEEDIPCLKETSTDDEKETPTVSVSFDEDEECNTPDNHVIIPPAPEIPMIALPKLPLDIEIPTKEKTELKVPKPNVCVRNIVAERVVPNIICRKTNSASNINLVPNQACKHT